MTKVPAIEERAADECGNILIAEDAFEGAARVGPPEEVHAFGGAPNKVKMEIPSERLSRFSFLFVTAGSHLAPMAFQPQLRRPPRAVWVIRAFSRQTPGTRSS